MDLVRVTERVLVVESVVHRSDRHPAVVQELDRLAEYLVGHTAPEAQGLKQRIQELIAQVAPAGRDVMVYVEIYCR